MKWVLWGLVSVMANQILSFLLKAECCCGLTEDGVRVEREPKSLSGTQSAPGTNIGHPKCATDCSL